MRALILTVMVGLFASAANATVAYSSFGPGETYSTNTRVVGSFNGPNYTVAMAFTVSETIALGEIRLPLEYFGIGPNVLNVSIYTDNGGEPDTALETIVTSATDTLQVQTVYSALNPQLVAAEDYWMVLSSAGRFGWALSPLGQTGFKFSTDGGATWDDPSGNTTISAFSVAVPEPAAALAALGLLPLLSRRRHVG